METPRISSRAVYTSEGVVLTIYGKHEGLSLIIRDDMRISAIEKHIAEVCDWLEA